MNLTLLTTNQLQDQALRMLNAKLESGPALAELLRCELNARTVCSRRSLCERVRYMLAPVHCVEVEQVGEILGQLEDNGDVTAGPRGMVAATPLRVVDAGEGRHLVRGSIPTHLLRRQTPFDAIETTLGRTIVLAAEEEELIAEAVGSFDGLLLSAARWSGLDRSAPADASWLADLDSRLEHRATVLGGLDDEITGGWRAYVPQAEFDSQRLRWQKDVTTGRLWQARHERGYRVHVWTAGAKPNDQPCVRLTGDEVSRSMFAIDREAEAPLVILVSRQGESAELLFTGRFPLAEYRYLTTMGEFVRYLDGSVLFRFRQRVVNEVTELLEQRLGVVVEAEEGET